MKNNKVFPLSLDEISGLLGNNESKEVEFTGVAMVKKKDLQSEDNLLRALSDSVFKIVYDEWSKENGVVVGKDKLLTQAKIVGCEIIEQVEALKGTVMVSMKLKAFIEQDLAYAQELKEQESPIVKRKKMWK